MRGRTTPRPHLAPWWSLLAGLLALALLASLSGCSRGPAPEALQQDVAARLARALPPGTLALEHLHRRGSQSDVKARAEQGRRVIVYFDAELRLARDYDFGAWDSPGVAGLVSALGTGPKGLVGVVSGGNKQGDLIHAHGTAIYREDGGSWVAVAPEGFTPSTPREAATGATPTPETMLEAMRTVIARTSRENAPAAHEMIVQELQAAQAAIQARLARAAQGYAVAAGPEGGQYLRFVQALAVSGAGRPGQHTITPLLTAGGVENLQLLRSGRASLALAQGDSAEWAYAGRGPFASAGPHSTLQAIGSLYPEPVHVIVRADSKLRTLSQLRERKVAIGVAASASRLTALTVLQAHGISTKQMEQLVELPLRDALIALQHQTVDAVVHVVGFPADSIRDAAAAIPLRLLSLEPTALRSLTATSPAYFVLTLPPGTYPQQTEPVTTLATAAVLLASTDLTDAEVTAFTRLLYAAGQDLLAKGSAQGAQLSAASARVGLAVPQHPAAAAVLDAAASAP